MTRKAPRRHRKSFHYHGGAPLTFQEVQTAAMELLQEMRADQLNVHENADNTFTIQLEDMTESSSAFLPCLEIYRNRTMRIEYLSQCDPLYRNAWVERFIAIARRLCVTEIVLCDDDRLHFSTNEQSANTISISTCHLLMYGETWYQIQGFLSVHDDRHTEWNDSIRALPFETFIGFVIDKENEERRKQIRSEFRQLIQALQSSPWTPHTSHGINIETAQKMEHDMLREVVHDDFLTAILQTFSDVRREDVTSDAVIKMSHRALGVGNAQDTEAYPLFWRMIHACTLEGDNVPLIQYDRERGLRVV